MMRRSLIALAASLLMSAVMAVDKPPRIGLVLGGGGARGLAHLGVLEQLEKLRIPISCIAGTSAGALVGGTYATGRPVNEIIAKVEGANWNQLLSGSPERRQLPFPDKINDYKNLAGVTLGLGKDGVMLPRSVVGSEYIDRFLRELTQDSYLQSFGDLAIPFQAIATNLISGDIKVFDSGNLAMAMRASMAVPGAFDLVQMNGDLYVDGMFVRNLPVENIKGRCADIVIAVDVGTPSLKADQIHSLLNIIEQSMNVATGRNVIEQRKLLGPQDILIEPVLDGYSPASFADAKDIIQRGRQLTPETLARLSSLSVDEASYAQWKSGLGTYLAGLKGGINKIEIAQTGFVPRPRVEEIVVDREPPKSEKELQQRLDRLYSTGNYDHIEYFVRDENGERVAVINPVVRSVGPNYLRFGTVIEMDTFRNADIALLGNYQMTWVNRWGAQWRNDVRLGYQTRFSTEFFQPFGDSPWFASANARFATGEEPVFNGQGQKYYDLSVNDLIGGVDLGYSLGRYGEFRIGPFARRNSTVVETGFAIGENSLTQTDVGARAQMVVDQLDNPRFPRAGYHLLASYLYGESLSTSQYQGGSRSLKLTGDLVETFGKTTIRGSLRFDQGDGPSVTSFNQLGGFLQLSGLQTDQLLGQKSVFGRVMAYQQIAPLLPMLGSGTYVGASLEAGRMFQQLVDDQASPIVPSASLWLGVDTFMGPLYLGGGWSNYHGGNFAGYLYLGYMP